MNINQHWKWLLIGYIVGSLFGFMQVLGMVGGGYTRVERAV